MVNNTKLPVILSFLIVFLGLGFLWFGFKPETEVKNAYVGPSSVLGIEGEKTKVTEVVDGDTFKIENGETVRLIGIDTPETKDPRRPVGCFGREASRETKKIIDGQIIILQKDVSGTDKYKRLLRYVFLPLSNGRLLFVNDYLVREGFARVLTYPPDVKYNGQFRQAESEARENKKGLWGSCQRL